jgi:predicted RecA/RadA family phage recombinase
MKNFISAGNTLTITAGADFPSGSVVVVGAAIGIATADIASGAEGTLLLEGVFDIPKAPSQAWTVGAAVYWDGPQARATTQAEDNALLGIAVQAVGSGAGETTGRVRLNDCFGVPVINAAP